jgi:serine/threonine protein phosphatase PrpC
MRRGQPTPSHAAHASTVEIEIASDLGQRRTSNEDRVRRLVLGTDPSWGVGVLVADGMGGASGGETASRIVAETVAQRLADWQTDPERLGHRWRTAFAQHLRDMLDGVQTKLLAAVREDPSLEGMGSTIAFLLVFGDRYVAVHVGDSRIYRLRGNRFAQLTRDHAHRAAGSAGRGALTQVLGGATDLEPSFSTGALEEGDLFLVATDGLFGDLSTEALVRPLVEGADLRETARRLLDAANGAGGRDNISLGLLRVTAAPAYRIDDRIFDGGSGGSDAPVVEWMVASPNARRRRAPTSPSQRRRRRVLLVMLLLLLGAAGSLAASYLSLAARTERARPPTPSADDQPSPDSAAPSTPEPPQ